MQGGGLSNPCKGEGRWRRDASYTHLAVAETSGDGQDLQAAVATLVAGEGSGERERGKSERGRVDWVGLTDPDPSLSG
jgi:hypothetical protein